MVRESILHSPLQTRDLECAGVDGDSAVHDGGEKYEFAVHFQAEAEAPRRR